MAQRSTPQARQLRAVNGHTPKPINMKKFLVKLFSKSFGNHHP
ncbi:hypothetical protein [Acetobacter sp.]|jgi:hypothetical protein|nr:hypothetical protein [Acetobacter sp.]